MKKVLISMLVVVALLLAVSCSTSYTVAFNTMGGTPEKIASQTVAAGGVATQPSPNPTKTGYDFTGWYQDEACTVKWDFANKVTKNMTLYAGWTQATVYHTVTFETFGEKPVPEPQKVKHNTAATKPTVQPAPEKGSFTYWSSDTKGLKGDYFAVGNTNVVTEDTVLYAQYANVEYVTVTFETNGGTPVPGAQTLKVNAAGYATGLIRPTNPTINGFTFTGWYYDASCATQASGTSGSMAALQFTADTTLYAGYKAAYPGDEKLFKLDPTGTVILGWSDEATSEIKSSLTTVVIPDGVKAIYDGTGTSKGLFYNMKNLTVVYVPSTLVKIGAWTFEGCTGLKAIKLTTDAKAIDETKAIANVTLSVPANVTDIGASAFKGCTGFGKVELLGADSIPANIFDGCTQITSISAPKAEIVDGSAYNNMGANLVTLSYIGVAKEANLGAMTALANYKANITLSVGKDFVATKDLTYDGGVNAFKVLNVGDKKDVKIANNLNALNNLIMALGKDVNVLLTEESYGAYGTANNCGVRFDNASGYVITLTSDLDEVELILDATETGLEDVVLSGKASYVFDMGGNANMSACNDWLEELLQVENASIVGRCDNYNLDKTSEVLAVAKNVTFTQAERTYGAANDTTVSVVAGKKIDCFENLTIIDEIPTGLANASTVSFVVDDVDQLVEALNASNVIVKPGKAAAATAPAYAITKAVTVVGKGDTLNLVPASVGVTAGYDASLVSGLDKLTVSNKDLVIKVANDATSGSATSFDYSANFVNALKCANAKVVADDNLASANVGITVASGVTLGLKDAETAESYDIDLTAATSFNDFTNLTVERAKNEAIEDHVLYNTTYIKVASVDAVKDVAKAKTPAIKVSGELALDNSYEFTAANDVVLYFVDGGYLSLDAAKEAANVTIWAADDDGLGGAFAGSTVKTVVVNTISGDVSLKAKNVDLNGFTVGGLTITKDGTTVKNGSCGTVAVNAGTKASQVKLDSVKVTVSNKDAITLNGVQATADSAAIPGYLTLTGCTITFDGTYGGALVVNSNCVATFDGGTIKKTTADTDKTFSFIDVNGVSDVATMAKDSSSSISFGSKSIKLVTVSNYSTAAEMETGEFDGTGIGTDYSLTFSGTVPTVKYGDTWELNGLTATYKRTTVLP